MAENITACKATFEWLKAQRQPHDNLIEDVQHLILPFRGDITTAYDPDHDRVSSTFDATAVNALDVLVSFLMGSIFPPNEPWIRMLPLKREDMLDAELRRALSEADEELLRALDDSNFYVVMPIWLRDLMGIGNACLMLEERAERLTDEGMFGGVDFEAIPYAKLWRLLDRNRRTLILGREFSLHPSEAVEFFGKDSWSGNEKICFRNLVKRNSEGMWVSYWWEEKGDSFVLTQTMDTLLYVPSVLDLIDGQNYGVGRGHLVRATVAGMQELTRQILQAAGRDLNPMLLLEHDSFMNVDMGGNGVITLKRSITRDPSFLTSGSNFAAADQIRRLDREQVNIAFYSDVLMEPETEVRVAEAARQKSARLANRLAGPAQAISYHLSQIVDAVVGLMRRAGALQSLDGIENVRYSFVSPFFTAQKQNIVDRIANFLTLKTQLAAALQDQGVLDDIDVDATTRLISDNSSLPGELFLSSEKTKSKRDTRAQIAAEQRNQAAAGLPPAQSAEVLPELPGIEA